MINMKRKGRINWTNCSYFCKLIYICNLVKLRLIIFTPMAICNIFWFVSDIPEAVYLQTFPKEELQEIDAIYFTQCGPNWSTEAETIFRLVTMAFLYAVPLAFMSIAYIQIIRVLWKSGHTPNHAFGKIRLHFIYPVRFVWKIFILLIIKEQ